MTAQQSQLKLIKPPVYVFNTPNSWAWVKLSDLATVLGISPKDVWGRFFALAKDYGLMSVTSETDPNWVKVDEDGELAGPRGWNFFLGSIDAFDTALESGNLLVPYPWANCVQELVKKGVAYVVYEMANLIYDEPEDYPTGVVDYVLEGITYYAIKAYDAKDQPVNLRSK